MTKRLLILAVFEAILMLSPTLARANEAKLATIYVGEEIVKVYEPWQVPVADFRLTQKFSYFHPGVDLAVPFGTPVRPALSGTVVAIEKKFWGYGYNILINHGDGYATLYAHLSKIYVKEGERVDKQTLIGESGSTGNSTGPHVHFEVRLDGKAINPTKLLELGTLSHGRERT